MSENFISSLHIQKLGHKIQEIRIRALNHIISKLDHGFITNIDFARYLELLKKLFQWFDFKPHIEEEKVLNLIYRILKSDMGVSIVKHIGTDALYQDLENIIKSINKLYHAKIEKIIEIIQQANNNPNIVPPLISDLPLSYRSDEPYNYTDKSRLNSGDDKIRCSINSTYYGTKNYTNRTIETTASPISGLEIKSSTASGLRTGPSLNKIDTISPVRDLLYKSIPFVTLNWQPLVKSDCHVLKSVEESLQKPPQPTVLLHSCDFFCNVMLQDFPAEVFLQRPANLSLFYDMIANSPSTRITNAALVCLNKLSENLINRIRYYSDPSTYNLKQGATLMNESEYDTSNGQKNVMYNLDIQQLGGSDVQIDDSTLMQCNQVPLPQYCMKTIICVLTYIAEKPQSFKDSVTKKKTQTGINTALQLIDRLIILTTLCIKPKIWDNQNDSTILEISNQLIYCFETLGTVLEQYRLMVVATDMEYFERMAQLHLLHSTSSLLSKLVPITKADTILPRSLKNSLSSSLLDASFGRLYPVAHETLVHYVNEFKGYHETESLTKYKDVQEVCNAMTKTIKIIKNNENIHKSDIFYMILKSLPSFEFHKNLGIINLFLKNCVKFSSSSNSDVSTMKVISETLVLLLSHVDNDIRKETYNLCQKLIVNILGLKHTQHMSETDPGSQITFFLQPDVLIEISAHGVTSDSVQIQSQAEDILIHILKCKFVVSESVWNKVIKAVMASMPILQCHADYDTPLGKSIVKIVDPDISPSLFIAPIDVLKGNLRMLFCKDIRLRNEAVSRLCWLLTTEKNAISKIPKIKSLEDCGLSYMFQIDYQIDLSRKRKTHQFYQVSSLHQVLDLLSTPNIEPSIRRSALTQISVMLEDHFMHPAFLQQNGLALIFNILENSLNEKEFHNYPDSVIPVISILKNICLHNAIIRQEMSQNIDLIYNILRGLFLYCMDKRIQVDGALLCCLLLFSEFAIYNYSGRDIVGFSLPNIVVEKFNIPFKCNTHWKTSRHAKPSLTGLLMSDDWCKSTLRMHWNIEWYGGITEIISWSEVPDTSELTMEQLAEFSIDLRLTKQDLMALKASSVEHCCQQYLYDIENATTHQSVLEAIRGITGYIALWLLANNSGNYSSEYTLLNLPWNASFYRFLTAPPANIDDQNLLIELLRCLVIMLKLYKNSGKTCWIADILQDTSHYLPKLLKIDVGNEHRLISLELLTLIANCSTLEQHLIDVDIFTGTSTELDTDKKSKRKNWIRIIQIITENLKFSDTEQFYNLAYLDKLLLCLVQITSSIGWSESQTNSTDLHKLFQDLIEALSELLTAFHYGKGVEAASSFMGLNITRNALLSMNHILYEMQQSCKKNWESYWVNDTICSATVFSLFSLWSCRDVVVRAATLQLLSGLALSPRGATVIVENVRHKCSGIWETTLMILLDHSEASVVREQAAVLLTNLTSHVNVSGNGQPALPLCHAPLSANQDISPIDTVLLLLKEYNFFEEIEILLSCLHLESTFTPSLMTISKHKTDYGVALTARSYVATSSSSSKSSDNGVNVFATPSLVKAVANFISNLVYLTPTKLCNLMAESGLIRRFFRCLTTPPFNLNDCSKYLLYTDILQMCSAVCSLLTRSVLIDTSCRIIALNTRDCIHVLVSLLNPNLYNISNPHFLYLRNQLWCEIFRFLTALLEFNIEKNIKDTKNEKEILDSCRESFTVISSILVESGHDAFIKSLCESIESKNSLSLQKSALQSLTSLLTVETLLPTRTLNSDTSSMSLQMIFDGTKSSRSILTENIENTDSESEINLKDIQSFKRKSISDTYKHTLEGNVICKRKKDKTCSRYDIPSRSSNSNINIMIGAELCKILLNVYELQSIENNKDSKRKSIIINALSSLLNLSVEAKKYALNEGFLDTVLIHLKNLHVELSLYSAESFRKLSDKKKICPILKEVNSLFCLVTNFISGCDLTKKAASASDLADTIHKFWIWFSLEHNMLLNVLKLLCTFTTDEQASQSLTLTNPVPGSGPRKVATNVSLLTAIINLITKEMELISKSHDTIILQLSFQILQNVCSIIECRAIITKSNLFNTINRLHPASTKRQKPWETVEYLWIEFLEVFTFYPEGQVYVAKSNDILELLMTLTTNAKPLNKLAALSVLRNVAFHQSNRIKLLATVEFIQILHSKLMTGTNEEKSIIISIIWALAANSQKSKLALKCVGLDARIQEVIKQYEMQGIDDKSYQTMLYVLGVLREGEK